MAPDKALQVIAVVGVFALMLFCLCAVVFAQIPKEQLNLFTALASGVIGSALGTVVGFLFGSSLGSRNKDATLASQAQP